MMLRFLLFAALSLFAATATDAQSTTYDFTATVTSINGSFGSLAIGSSLTGTATFDLGPGNVNTDLGTIGTPAYWVTQTASGPSYASIETGPATAFVFNDTLSGGGFSYTSAPLATPYSQYSAVAGCTAPRNACSGSSFLEMMTQYSATSSPFSASSTSLDFLGGTAPLYSSSGLPILAALSQVQGTGQLFVAGTGQVSFSITGVNAVSAVGAVPEPSTYAMLIAGLISTGVMQARRLRRSGAQVSC